MQYFNNFVIRELAEEFEGQFECLGKSTEKYLNFSVPIEKKIDNSGKTTHKIKLIYSFRFMSSILSNCVDNLLVDFIISNSQIVSLILNIYQLKKMNY